MTECMLLKTSIKFLKSPGYGKRVVKKASKSIWKENKYNFISIVAGTCASPYFFNNSKKLINKSFNKKARLKSHLYSWQKSFFRTGFFKFNLSKNIYSSFFFIQIK